MPRKAYLEFDDDPDAAFEFMLAYKLKKTIAEIQDMPQREFMRWYVWLGRLAQEKELAAKKGK